MASPLDNALITVTFRGDNSPLTRTINATERTLEDLARTKRAIFSQDIFSSKGILPGILDKSGTAVTGLKTRLERELGTFSYSADITRNITRVINGQKQTIASYQTEAKVLRGNAILAEKLSAAYSDLGDAITLTGQKQQRNQRLIGESLWRRSTKLTERDAAQQAFEARFQSEFRTSSNNRLMYRNRFVSPESIARLREERLLDTQEGQAFSRAERRLQREINLLGKRTNKAREYRDTISRLGLEQEDVAKKIEAAYKAPPPLPPSIERLAKQSPQFYQTLRRQGLGGAIAPGRGIEDIAATMGAQGVKSRVSFDEVRQVTRATVSWRGFNNEIRSSTIELDKNGKVLTRWGSTLSGISSTLNQTGRNIFKVVQWTVATTAVLGAVNALSSAIDTVKELDKNMRSFGITAQMSTTETRKFFTELSRVAIQTATPILELTKAADDMALATRKANQTTNEWQSSIVDLANAVGILTNLSGMDTVQATDLLTSTMKQLGLTTTDLVPILNKITAVAGGQQNAITDIARGMGVMSEAASQAGLDTDQTIATIQVLSQVTSKSAAEVATAFKNLVGSIDSRASIKALDEFGIAVRDESGNLRNFLDIYAEIQKAIETGIIPEGRVKEIIKAISGGPRRAPDASALLANVGQIFTVQERAINATNEALVANAKILDTVNAKTIQLQNSLKALFFEKFGDAIRENYSSAIDIFMSLIGFINAIPTGIIAGIGPLAAFGAAIWALNAAIVRASSAVKQYNQDKITQIELSKLNAGAIDREAAALANYANMAKMQIAKGLPVPSMQQYLSGIGGPSPDSKTGFTKKELLGMTAIAAAIPGAYGLATNGVEGLTSSLDDMATSAGIQMLIQLPGAAKIAGIGMIGLGAIINEFTNKNKKSKEEIQALEEALLTQLQTTKNLKITQEDLIKKQDTLLNQISSLTSQQKLSSEQQVRLNDLTRQYSENMATATKNSIDFRKTLEELGITASSLESTTLTPDLLTALSQGGGTSAMREDAIKQLTKKILEADPTLKATFTGEPFTPTATSIGKPSGSTIATMTRTINNVTKEIKFNLRELEKSPEKIVRLFDGFGNLSASIEITGENIRLLETALNSLEESGGRNVDNMRVKIAELAKTSVLTENTQVFNTQRAFIQASSILGEEGFSAREADERLKNLDAYYKLSLKTAELPTIAEKDQEGRTTISQGVALSRLQNTLFKDGVASRAITIDQVKSLAEAYPDVTNQIKEVAKENKKLQDSMYAIWGSSMGLAIQGIDFLLGKVVGSSQEVADAIDVIAQKINALADSQTELNRSLFKEFLSGNITKQQLDKQIGAVADFYKTFESLRSRESDFLEATGVTDLDLANPAIESFLDNLSEIPFFSNAASKGFGALLDDFEALVSSGELSAEGMLKIIAVISTLDALLQKLEGREIDIKVNIKQDFTTTQASRRRGPQPEGINPTENTSLTELIKNELNKALEDIKDLLSSSSFKQRGGGGADSGSTTQIDLAKELIPLSPAIVAKIVKEARDLQDRLGLTEENKNDRVSILNGLEILTTELGLSADMIRQAMDANTDMVKKKMEQESKADSIRRIRIGSGEFAGIANVPLNRLTGASMAAQGPLNVRLDINGQILTPAQLREIANMVVASMKTRD